MARPATLPGLDLFPRAPAAVDYSAPARVEVVHPVVAVVVADRDPAAWRAVEAHVLGNGQLGPARTQSCPTCSLTWLASRRSAPDAGRTACAVGLALYAVWEAPR